MLTKRQKQIFEYFKRFIKENDYAPTLEEARRHFKLSSKSTIHKHLETLKSKEYLDKLDYQTRAIQISGNKKSTDLVEIPLLGTIAAGQPIETYEIPEKIAVPKSYLPGPGEHFALKVGGDSMIEEGIFDGDTVIIKKQPTANNGETVVALVNGSEVTLKKIYKEKNRFRLQPANPDFKPIFTKKLVIQGRVIRVIRNFEELKEKMNLVGDLEPQTDKPLKNHIDPRNKVNDLSAKEWLPETISVFVQKGLGANHPDTEIEKQHPAPFSFQDIARLIKFFTKKGQKVLDPFNGVGSTLKACALSDRHGYGIELNKKYHDLARERLKREVKNTLFEHKKQVLIHGDALKEIDKFKDDFFDFIITSPPYWNILNKIDHKVKQERVKNNLDTKYSEDKRDLGNIENYDIFLEKLADFFNNCSGILKPKKYLCIIVSDFRHKDKYYTFHSDLVGRLEKYTLKGITILYQRHKKVFPYGYPFSYVPNIHHQYILILQNYVKKK